MTPTEGEKPQRRLTEKDRSSQGLYLRQQNGIARTLAKPWRFSKSFTQHFLLTGAKGCVCVLHAYNLQIPWLADCSSISVCMTILYSRVYVVGRCGRVTFARVSVWVTNDLAWFFFCDTFDNTLLYVIIERLLQQVRLSIDVSDTIIVIKITLIIQFSFLHWLFHPYSLLLFCLALLMVFKCKVSLLMFGTMWRGSFTMEVSVQSFPYFWLSILISF